jgi:hypothetical protein
VISVASPAQQKPRKPEVTRRRCLGLSCLRVICTSGSFTRRSRRDTRPVACSPLEDGFGRQHTPTGQAILEIHGLVWRSAETRGAHSKIQPDQACIISWLQADNAPAGTLDLSGT